MPEPLRGKLVWQVTGDKRNRRVIFPTKKGMSIPTPFDASQLAASLVGRNDDEIEVELELEKGRPVRIRPVGEPFVPTAPAQPSPGNQGPQTSQRSGGPAQQKPHPQPHPSGEGASSGSLAPDFHNPYNFVPAPPRDQVTGELGDQKPVGHHCLFPDRYTGVIRVKMTAITPLLILDAGRAEELPGNHKSFPVRLDADGKPYVPPTSVKGMLRAAYEAITNSRFAVFPYQEADCARHASGHAARLAYRRPARIEVVPARIEASQDQEITIRILSRLWLKSAARLPRYQQHVPSNKSKRKGEEKAALRYPDGKLPQHGDHVRVRVDKTSGLVTQIRRYELSGPDDGEEGWVLITEPNIGNKKYERVYVVDPNDQLLTFRGPDAVRVVHMWNELIENYQQAHEKDLEKRRLKQPRQEPNEYLGHKPGQTAWSRHVWDKSYTALREGTLCYVRLLKGSVQGIYPVSISRDLFPVSPLSLLPATLRPATSIAQLSPADRVFGWVNQQGHGAYKGNVRIGPVTCKKAASEAIEGFGKPGLPLAILGQPKPQQARFYVAQNPQGQAQPKGLSKEQAGYQAGKGLRGRKVYPHHFGLPEEHWDNPMEDRTQQAVHRHFQEYRRPKQDNEEVRDDQNRSVQGWVKPGTEFTFEIEVTNLSAVELGALLWLLTLPQDHFHRFGGGKPLGFGSVRLEIESAELFDGNGWKTIYCHLDEVTVTPAEFKPLIDAFKEEVRAAYPGNSFEQVPFIAAWLRSATGHRDRLPTHYPRARWTGHTGPVPPNPQGLAYEWFVNNERQRGGKTTHGYALPDLASDPGLPIL
ncbi:MAG: TIGR03986 family CRISPR-associated RAMP protein [Gemmataceae bacterium]|nr:TIGR03986 family CRISPR-associated RAMP protein [Gemmataceae bacterium]MDW8265800.1 TIGR03986 family CRISPR-associated RAMP protein [Gemmataceae bacterium]